MIHLPVLFIVSYTTIFGYVVYILGHTEIEIPENLRRDTN
jgi:hypothetical protein